MEEKNPAGRTQLVNSHVRYKRGVVGVKIPTCAKLLEVKNEGFASSWGGCVFSLVSEWDWAEDMCEVGKREGGTLNVLGSSEYKDKSCPMVELAYSPYDDSAFQPTWSMTSLGSAPDALKIWAKPRRPAWVTVFGPMIR